MKFIVQNEFIKGVYVSLKLNYPIVFCILFLYVTSLSWIGLLENDSYTSNDNLGNPKSWSFINICGDNSNFLNGSILDDNL